MPRVVEVTALITVPASVAAEKVTGLETAQTVGVAAGAAAAAGPPLLDAEVEGTVVVVVVGMGDVAPHLVQDRDPLHDTAKDPVIALPLLVQGALRQGETDDGADNFPPGPFLVV